MLSDVDLSGFRGTLLRPDDAGFEASRHIFNRRFDGRPSAIARPLDAADVAVAVRAARSARVPFAVRAGGHNFAGYAVPDAGLVLDVRGLRRISVDVDRRHVTVGAGLTWGEVDLFTHRHGLAAAGGSMSKVGVGGFTLGTGLGWLATAHGLAADNLLGCAVVTAEGTLLEAGPDREPDLFWALRGGTGNFGVVTEFRFRLHEVHTVIGGTLVYPIAEAARVVRAVRDATLEAPDKLSWAAVFCHAPPLPPWPRQHWGRPVLLVPVCWCGPLAAGEKVIALLRAAAGPPQLDLIQPITYPEFQRSADASAPDGACWDVRSEWLSTLDDAAVDALVDAAHTITAPLSEVLVRPLGGCVADGPDTPFSYRAAGWLLEVLAGWYPGDDAQAGHLAWMERAWRSLLRVSAGGPCISHLGVGEGPARARAAYNPATLRRLADVKRRYDPDRIFQAAPDLFDGGP